MILHVHLLHRIEKKLKHPYNSLNLELSSNYIDSYLKNHLVSLGKYKIEKIESDKILPKYTKKFFLERGGYYQVKLIETFENELFSKISEDKDSLKDWIKILNIHDGDMIRLNRYGIRETYIYLQGNFVKLSLTGDLYFEIPYNMALQIPGSVFWQYCQDTKYGFNIDGIYLTYKDEIWKILNLSKYDKKFKFKVGGVFSYFDCDFFIIHNCIMKERNNTCKFYIEDVEIIYHKDAKRINFYSIPDKPIYNDVSDDFYYYYGKYEKDWIKFKGVLEQVMEKMI